MRRLATPVAALVACLALVGCGQLQIEPTAPPKGMPTAVTAASANKELDQLNVAPMLAMSGYSRDLFHVWSSQGGGCDTRDVVLKRQGSNLQVSSDCKITSGTWVSPYNQKTYTNPRQIQIDHLVPLGNAWISGARNWSADQREAFANDLTRPQLIAVDASDNEAKGDSDPSEWKPPNQGFWCTYAEDWVTVKTYWKLAVTEAEKSALADMLSTCH
jgi:hypothetical protein